MKKLLFGILLATLIVPSAWFAFAQSAAKNLPTRPPASDAPNDSSRSLRPLQASTPAVRTTQPRRPSYAPRPQENVNEGLPEVADFSRPSPRGGMNMPQVNRVDAFGNVMGDFNVEIHRQPDGFMEANGKTYRMTTRARTVLESHAEEISTEELERYKQFLENVQKFRKADASEQDRKSAREIIEKLVNAEIDRDLEQREKQLGEIEAKAKQLREQLEKRRGAKTEMLNMNMMMIENPSAGLGLPAEWMRSLIPAPVPTVGVNGLRGWMAPVPGLANPKYSQHDHSLEYRNAPVQAGYPVPDYVELPAQPDVSVPSELPRETRS